MTLLSGKEHTRVPRLSGTTRPLCQHELLPGMLAGHAFYSMPDKKKKLSRSTHYCVWSDYLDKLQNNYKHFKLKRENLHPFVIHTSHEYYNVNLVHSFVDLSSRGASISMISISLDVRRVQKSYFLGIVDVRGKRLKQMKKMNIPQHLLIVHCGNSVQTDGR